MKHLFIPYELAVIAKEKGFNQFNCFANFYDGKLIFPLEGSVSHHESISAPLYQQIVDWFRETEGFYIEIVRYDVGHFEFVIKSNMATENSKTTFTDYYEALNKAIEEAFKLI